MKLIFAAFLLAVATAVCPAASIIPVPDKVPCVVADLQAFQQPDHSHLTGWVGGRIEESEKNRLVKIDPERLLEGYRKRPGRQSWDGEHVGKWLHAAVLAWVNTGDSALRAKLDYTVAELAKCQLADGYLGTYVEKNRWTEWDVWAHKYNLIGLITYMRYTGNMSPMPVCRRMADLLCDTFGDAPGKRDIIRAGEHVGMAPTSVLEPMVLLYRMTGEPRYLDFCKYILRAWEQPNGPKIVSRLLEVKRVDKVGNGKAYEMLSCLNGALEYYRTTGDKQILDACQNAWQDIVAKRLYLTGTASYGELFHDDFDLPNTGNVGETCVTVTWLQFNAQLLRLTGEARFADQLERVVLNQLLGAQRPDCAAWGYYVQMEGKKPYSDSLDGHCCLSSGPRGVSLIPTFAVSADADGPVINLYDAGKAELILPDATPVSLVIDTSFPKDGAIGISVNTASKNAFTIKLRIPAWSGESSVTVNGSRMEAPIGHDGYAAIKRVWAKDDKIGLKLKLEPRVVVGDHKNAGKVAVLYGPLVLTADDALMGDKTISMVAIENTDVSNLGLTPEPAPDNVKTWPGAQVYRIHAVSRKSSGDIKSGAPMKVRLIPFGDAGGAGTSYKVWLPLPKAPGGNLLSDGVESRSRQGNANGSVNDEEYQSYVVTFDNRPAKEDWFAVSLDSPVSMKRFVFMHGNSFHDGGWFDTSAGKPKVEVRKEMNGDWESIGELSEYPATTATSDAKLKSGQAFTLRLSSPASIVAIRVVGKPASGDNSAQAFSSCAEMQAFAD